MPGERDEHVCLEMRRHGVVLARPLARSGGVAIAGIFILTLPWAAAAVIGAALIAVAAAFTLRAVWQWERTRIVVTTEKLYVDQRHAAPPDEDGEAAGGRRGRARPVAARAAPGLRNARRRAARRSATSPSRKRSASSSKSSRPDGSQNRFPHPGEEPVDTGARCRPSDWNGELNMRKILVVTTVLASSLVLTGLGLGSSTTKWRTQLTAKLNNAQEVPKPDADEGTGRFTGTLTGRSLKWKLTFRHLTGSASAAHIHLGKRGEAGAVAVRSAGRAGPACTGRRRSTRAWPKRSRRAAPTSTSIPRRTPMERSAGRSARPASRGPRSARGAGEGPLPSPNRTLVRPTPR